MIVPPHADLERETADLGLFGVLREDGAIDASTDARTSAAIEASGSLDPALLLSAYRHMRRLRLLDARMILLQRQGRVGFYGPCTGQEAVPIATGLALHAGDWVFPALREHSVMLVRGFPLRTFVAQIFGNSGDVQKGRQMPSHQASRQVHQVSWSSCIGPQVPQAVGAAWAMKMRKADTIALAFLGDGATSQPDFHTAMTFAARFSAPVVIVCQNNHWAISVPATKQTASKTLAMKARAYGMRGVRIDGNDVVAVHHAISEAATRARRGDGPSFVEAVTYRIGAHSTSDDPSRYRSDDEVDAWKRKDPVDRLAAHLRGRGLLDAASDARLEAELTAEIAAVVDEVEALPPPARAELFDDVYAELPWHLRQQRAELVASPLPKPL